MLAVHTVTFAEMLPVYGLIVVCVVVASIRAHRRKED